MKIISISQLQIGNIFTYKMELKGREAFIVRDTDGATIEVSSRKTGNRYILKRSEKKIILLKESYSK